jgi:hypothetical protein
MFTGGDRGGEVDRTESRRRGHEHEGAVGGHDLLIGVIPDEDLRGRQLVGLVETVRTVLEGIRQRDDFRLRAEEFAGSDELTECASTAAAAPIKATLILAGTD